VTVRQRLLRLISAPVRRLLDGRFADVNRRVGDVHAAVAAQQDAVEKLGRDVSAHSTTQNEALSYTAVELRRMEEATAVELRRMEEATAVELRRMEEALRAHEEALQARQTQILDELRRLDERAYVQRLDHAGRGPLSELDGALAGAINRAAGHRGFAAQAGLWFNPPVTVELGEGQASISDVNERIVEVPFALGQLARVDPPAKILDVGGAESTFALSAACLGFRVIVLDPQGIPYEHPNLTSYACRLEEWQQDDAEPFAAAFLVSAIEHFGLGAYGEPAAGADADREALGRVRELLASDGLLVLTTPYGRAAVNDLERIYDDAALDRLLTGWRVLERHTIIRTDRRTWLPGTEGSAGTALIAATPLPSP
jgi:Caenorhabditis protein of unknown function, DUF268